MSAKSCILVFIIVTSTIAVSGRTDKRSDKRIHSKDSTIDHIQKWLSLDEKQADSVVGKNNEERGMNDDAELIPLLKQILDSQNKRIRLKKTRAKKKRNWKCGFCSFGKYHG